MHNFRKRVPLFHVKRILREFRRNVPQENKIYICFPLLRRVKTKTCEECINFDFKTAKNIYKQLRHFVKSLDNVELISVTKTATELGAKHNSSISQSLQYLYNRFIENGKDEIHPLNYNDLGHYVNANLKLCTN